MSQAGIINTVNGTPPVGSTLSLSDDVNAKAFPDGTGNIQLVGHVVEQGATKFSTTVTGTSLININPMSSARWIVDPLGFNGTHTTLGAAITSATSGDTIQILSGSILTENPTLKAGVDIVGLPGDSQTPNITIIGTLSASYSGTVTITNVRLQTNSANLLSLSGANATVLKLINCDINCTNNTGISSTGSNAAANILLTNCTGNLGTTGIALFTISNGGIEFNYCNLLNSGNSITSSTMTGSAALNILYSTLDSPITLSNTSTIGMLCSQIDTSAQNATSIVYNSTATGGTSSLEMIRLGSGTATTLTIGAGANLIINDLIQDSTNAVSISGSGTIQFGNIIQEATAGTITVTTQTGLNEFHGPINIVSPSLSILSVQSTDAGASAGPIEDLYRNSASPAVADNIGAITFTGNSSTGVKRQYSSILSAISSPTNTAEFSQLTFQTLNNGSVQTNVLFGNGIGQYRGTQGSTVAPAGFIGEVLSTNTAAPGTSLSTSMPNNVNNLTLTPGNWMIFGIILFTPAITTVLQGIFAGVNLTISTFTTSGIDYAAINTSAGSLSTGLSTYTINTPIQFVSISTNTTYFLNAQATFITSTCTAYGKIQAVRIG
jgi:hypothetical protein